MVRIGSTQTEPGQVEDTVQNPKFIQLMRALIAALAGLVWVVLVAFGIVFSWVSGDDPHFISSDGLVFILPGLTALVGGVVAVAFGVPAPKAKSEDGQPSSSAQVQSILSATTKGSKRALKEGSSELLGQLYIAAYLILGFIAMVTWMIMGGDTIDYVRTLASAWVGLILPIATSNFQPGA